MRSQQGTRVLPDLWDIIDNNEWDLALFTLFRKTNGRLLYFTGPPSREAYGLQHLQIYQYQRKGGM